MFAPGWSPWLRINGLGQGLVPPPAGKRADSDGRQGGGYEPACPWVAPDGRPGAATQLASLPEPGGRRPTEFAEAGLKRFSDDRADATQQQTYKSEHCGNPNFRFIATRACQRCPAEIILSEDSATCFGRICEGIRTNDGSSWRGRGSMPTALRRL